VVVELLGEGHFHGLFNKKNGKFALRETKQIMFGLAKGLKHLHERNIIHRDIKPENIMFRN